MIQRQVLLTISIIFSLLIVGCAPKGKGAEFSLKIVPEGKAAVYHYRLSKVVGSGASYNIYCNGEFVTRIGNGGYYVQHLEPGKYEFKKLDRINMGPINLITTAIANTIARKKTVYSMEVAPNKSYFLRWRPPGKVEDISKHVALTQLSGLKQFKSIE